MFEPIKIDVDQFTHFFFPHSSMYILYTDFHVCCGVSVNNLTAIHTHDITLRLMIS